MTYSAADKRRVYLACRAIFTGNSAQLRKQKKVRELVEKQKSSLAPLIRDFGITKVVEILRILLDGQAFQSDLKAKVEFPELFRSTPDRDIQRAESEYNAARSVAEALEEIASLGELEGEPDHANEDETALITPEAEKIDKPSSSVRDLQGYPPTLYPSYFPYRAQHIILATVQRILEECCFDFTKKWLPSVVGGGGWDCAESVELTKWTRILAKRSGKLPAHAFAIHGSELHDILLSTHRLRHTAVHRLPTTARGISKLIEAAKKCTEALQDSIRALQLDELHKEIDSKIKAMELNKNVLEDAVGHELEKIRRQREELERMEKDLIGNMKKEDLENTSLIGSLLEDSVRKIFSEEEPQTMLERDEDNSESKTEDDLNGVAIMNSESLGGEDIGALDWRLPKI